MKVVDKANAPATLAAYTDDVDSGPVVVTDQSTPVAVLVLIDNADLETITLSTNRPFIELIGRSRAHLRAGGISSDKMRHRLARPVCVTDLAPADRDGCPARPLGSVINQTAPVQSVPAAPRRVAR